MKILVIEDDVSLSNMLVEMLKTVGEVRAALTGEKGLALAKEDTYDIIILDLMLPGIQGDEVLRKLRQEKMTPVIVLSALGSVEKKVDLLNIGADDYLAKPFSRDELIARVKATLRRYNKDFEECAYHFGGLSIYYNSKMVTFEDTRLPIVGKMYEMLELLVKNKEIIVTKQQIFDSICGFYSDTIQTVIEVYAYKIRKLLASVGLADHLKTIKTIGYMWTEQ